MSETSYVKDAIDTIYGEKDDFIIIGLTGRTGSGCSTVANILCSGKNNIHHSLNYIGTQLNNDQRKQQIVLNFFEQKWQSFQLIQMSSIITLLLATEESGKVKNFLNEAIKEETKEEKINELLKLIKNKKQSFKTKIEQEEEAKQSIEFYTKILPSKTSEFRKILGESLFIKIYQDAGKNIRKSGNPFDKISTKNKFFTLAEKTNNIIKSIHKANKILSKKTLLVIDAIRNPLEALFFQERYAGFYLVAISCLDDNERQRRLLNTGLSLGDIETIDSEEYGKKSTNTDKYSVQDIKECLQQADIYISNPNEAHQVSKFHYLSNQIIKFASLMQYPGLVTPTAIERCMQLAYSAKLNSGCISRQVGAAITDKNFTIKSIGWNDVPHGQVPCNLRSRDNLISGKDLDAYSEYEKNNTDKYKYQQHMKEDMEKNIEKYTDIKKEGINLSYCFKSEFNKLQNDKNQVHTRSLHAEENAFLQIAKYGGSAIEGGFLFSTASPCELCAKKAYQLGITKIYYIDPYPGIATPHILKGGTRNPELILFSGAVGRAFHTLYSPKIPHKDELEVRKS